MHDSRVMWFYSVFGVIVIKSHLCVFSCVFYLTLEAEKKRGEFLEKIKKASQSQCWWAS